MMLLIGCPQNYEKPAKREHYYHKFNTGAVGATSRGYSFNILRLFQLIFYLPKHSRRILVIKRKAKRKWAFFNMMSVVRYHLTAYIDLFKFLKNLMEIGET
jgi:hypothetical protein